MGIEVIVHGFIEAPGYGGQEPSRRVYRHNRAVIRSLPEVDEVWPFFTRSMFSILPLRNENSVRIPEYGSLVIAFGASYKDMHPGLDANWIHKFERLLSRLCWNRALVWNDFSGLKYVWKLSNSVQWEGFFCDPPRPPTHWTLHCYQQHLDEIPKTDAIDGPYQPVCK
jgi:hypothetical protein